METLWLNPTHSLTYHGEADRSNWCVDDRADVSTLGEEVDLTQQGLVCRSVIW